MEPIKLAACGVDCNVCGQYKVTTERDVKSAELLVDWFREQGWIGEADGVEAIFAKNPLCKGCWNVTDECFWKCGCGKVDFRVCCKERRIDHCGECSDFPCENYKEWASWHESHQEAMARLLEGRQNT